MEFQAPSAYEESYIPESSYTLLAYDEDYWFVYSEDVGLTAVPNHEAETVRIWDVDERKPLMENKLPHTLNNLVAVFRNN